MATMIPSVMTEFAPESKEDLMFEALKKLPDDYYVFYSFRTDDIIEDEYGVKTLKEHETDFIIFHKDKGLLFLEAKAGNNIKCSYGDWYYSNGTRMAHGGPFCQARDRMYGLSKLIHKSLHKNYMELCNFIFGVWFPQMSEKDIKRLSLPQECTHEQIMPAEALEEPQKYIDRLFSIRLNSPIKRAGLDKNDAAVLIEKFLCPEVEVFQTQGATDVETKIKFSRMLKEQVNVIKYLEDQRFVVISGIAGTGKTVIALERAKRWADDKHRVLFLCYNKLLARYIEQNYTNTNIDYYTISGYACLLGGCDEPDYEMAAEALMEQTEYDRFPYKYVIIDEGQDFGRKEILNSAILDLLKAAVEKNDGAFYVFYDKLQMVQANKLAAFIAEADSKVTLYKNCRNTFNIAMTSVKSLPRTTKTIVKEGTVQGKPANLHFCNARELTSRLDRIVGALRNEGIENIVILTCSTIKKSCFAADVNEAKNLYKNKTPFYTTRMFKGLEADAIILVDVEKDHFLGSSNDPTLRGLFYVGASRARLRLEIITTMTESDCKEIIRQNPPQYSVKNYLKEFAEYLMANGRFK